MVTELEVVVRERVVRESGVWVTIAPRDFDVCTCAGHRHTFVGTPRDENGRLVSETCAACGCTTLVQDWDARHRGTDVFLTMTLLEECAEQGTWDSQFGQVLLINPAEGCALRQLGWAAQETKGGYHGTDALREWLKERH